MKSEQLQAKLLLLLEPDIYKTTAQLVEEFRMEYPSLWKELEIEGQRLYGNSCSSVQQPSTRIAQALQELPSDSCRRYSRGSLHYWSK
jgi:hypothetical protein